MTCGMCRHFRPYEGIEALRHIRRGRRGECTRGEGHCPNEQSRYSGANDLHPQVRYERESAGAHYAPIGERTEA